MIHPENCVVFSDTDLWVLFSFDIIAPLQGVSRQNWLPNCLNSQGF